MISVSDTFVAAIAEDCVRIAELYTCELVNGTVVRLTSHSEDVIWDAGGNTYTSAPGIDRGPIKRNSNGQTDEVEVSLGNMDGELYDKVAGNILEAAVVTIRRFRWDAAFAADEQFEIFRGHPNVAFNQKTLTLTNKAMHGSLNIMVPRDIYQPPCNRRLFDGTCGLNMADFAYSSTATGGTILTLIDTTRGTIFKVDFDGGDSDNPVEIGDALTGNHVTPGAGTCLNIVYLTASTGTIWYAECTHQFIDDEEMTGGGNAVTVNGTPAEDISYLQKGELRMTSGANSGQRRPILKNSADTLTIMWPMPTAIAPADDYTIYPGCDYQAATCRGRYGHEFYFRGFPYIPPPQETLFPSG